MIGYIKGILSEVGEETIILENNRIGFDIRVPGLVLDQLPAIGEEMKLYTYMHVREDDISLFGFLTKDELHIFKLLLSVSGVGPKGALGILSVLSGRDLRLALHTQDARAIAKAPGIGAKTAQRVIIDLKDKLKLDDIWEEDASFVSADSKGDNTVQKEAVEALTALGYSAAQAASAVKQVAFQEDMTVEDCLKQALKYF